MKSIQIAVIGGRTADERSLACAEKVGELIAKNGYQLICGGMGGIMEAACAGAHDAGGIAVGILPGASRYDANSYVTVPVATGIGVARNSIIAHSADAAIAISGRYGTLSEIAFFLQLGKPVVLLHCPWKIDGALSADSPEQAVMLIEENI